jgi:hypothetical protein
LLRSARKQIGLCVPGLLRANFDAMALKAFGLLRQGLIGLKKRKMGPERPVSPELSRKSLFFAAKKRSIQRALQRENKSGIGGCGLTSSFALYGLLRAKFVISNHLAPGMPVKRAGRGKLGSMHA